MEVAQAAVQCKSKKCSARLLGGPWAKAPHQGSPTSATSPKNKPACRGACVKLSLANGSQREGRWASRCGDGFQSAQPAPVHCAPHSWGSERCFFTATTVCVFSPQGPIQYLFLQCPLECHLLLCLIYIYKQYSIPLNSRSVFCTPLLHNLKLSILQHFPVILPTLYYVCYVQCTQI